MKNHSYISRRQFTLAVCTLLSSSQSFQVFAKAAQVPNFSGNDVFNRIIKDADAGNWSALPIGDLMGKIANELVGTPYVGGTLDRAASEHCTVDLSALDCVTFFESTLDFARMIKKGKRKPSDLVAEVSFARYRGGKPGNYTTRLHYTSDWLFDNQSKHVVTLLSDLPGSEPFTKTVNFMTTHRQSYPHFSDHPSYLETMKTIENNINKRKLTYVPIDKLAAVEPFLKTGDIVGICTDTEGLDIAHTGLILRDESNVPHFVDASSKKTSMKVTIEPGPISKTLSASKHNIGVMVARPLEP